MITASVGINNASILNKYINHYTGWRRVAFVPTSRWIQRLFTISLSFIFILFAAKAKAEWYKYKFKNDNVVVIGIGSPDQENPDLSVHSYISHSQAKGILKTATEEEVNRKLGIPELDWIFGSPIEGLIVINSQDHSELPGQPPRLPIKSLNNNEALADHQDAIMMLSRFNSTLHLVIVTSAGLVFKTEITYSSLDLIRSINVLDLISDLRLSGGFVSGKRAFLGISVKSPLGDRTMVVSQKLDSPFEEWEHGEPTLMDLTHETISEFYPDLKIKKGSSDSQQIDFFLQGTSESGLYRLNKPYRIATKPHRTAVTRAKQTPAMLEVTSPPPPYGNQDVDPNEHNQDQGPKHGSKDSPTQEKIEDPMNSENSYRLVSERNSRGQTDYYLERESDGKRVHFHVGDLDSPTLHLLPNRVVALEGAKRTVSLDHFDFEATYRLFHATPDVQVSTPGSGHGAINEAEDVVESSFEKWNPDLIDGLYFTDKDQKIVAKIKGNLRRKFIKSLVVLGDSGTGKTSLVNEALKSLPPTWVVYNLDVNSLTAGTGIRGQLESRIKAILTLAKTKPIVLFVDELHALVGAASGNHDGPDIFQQLKSALAAGQLIMVGTDTPDEFQEAIGTDNALKRRFGIIEIPPISKDELLMKLEFTARKQGFTQFNEFFFENLTRDSAQVLPQFNEPHRSSLVLDQIIANLEGVDPTSVRLTHDHLKGSLEKLTRLRMSLPKVQRLFLEARKKYRSKIVGADPAMETLFGQAESGFMGFYTGKGPMARILLTGPAGTGKSERGIAFAEAMNLPYLFVSPSMLGDGPQEVIGKIADTLEKDPFSVIILDEIEKYPEAFRSVLLNLLSNNRLTVTVSKKGNTSVRRTYTRFASIIATTNAGEESLEGLGNAMTSTLSGIGFMANVDPTKRDSRGAILSRIQYKELLKERLGKYLVDRFPIETSIVRIPTPDKKTLRKILLLRTSEKIRLAKEGNFLGIRYSTDKVGQLVDHVIEVAEREGYEVRDAEGLLNKLIDDYWKSQVKVSGRSKADSPPWLRSSRGKEIFSCLDLFKD